jgi:multiple sugar transport system ATP-binding protein
VNVAQVTLKSVSKSFVARPGEGAAPQPSAVAGSAASGATQVIGRPATHVLRQIDLTIADGEFMVLVGPSGCGKSTLLRLIAGLEQLTGGVIEIGERVVNQLPPKQRDIAMVFQSYALYPHMTVYDNLAFGLRRAAKGTLPQQPSAQLELPRPVSSLLRLVTRPFPKRWRYFPAGEQAIDQRVRTIARILQIEGLLQRLPKQLSGGQKQRVALGRAMARNPQVFLMDEPLSNLDAKLRAETRAQIVKLQRQLGTTTIYVTHDQTEAMTMGDRIAVMQGGEIQQLATPLELYNRPTNLFVAEFIGSPPMNFLPVRLESGLTLVAGDWRLSLPSSWAKPLAGYGGKDLILGVRAEHLEVTNGQSEQTPSVSAQLPVQVELVEALGHETYLAVSLQLAEFDTGQTQKFWQVRVSPDCTVRPGASLGVLLVLDKIHLFDAQTGKAIALEVST